MTTTILYAGCARDAPRVKAVKRTATKEPAKIWRVSSEPGQRAHSMRDGQHIVLIPSKVGFIVPKKWLEDNDLGVNLAVRPDELEKVANGTLGAWLEPASIANAVFPFDRCAAAAGSWKWDYGASLQLRVYYIADPLGELSANIRLRGEPGVLRLTGAPGTVSQSLHGKWSRDMIRYLWDNHQGFSCHAFIDCYSQRLLERTIVLGATAFPTTKTAFLHGKNRVFLSFWRQK